MHFEGANLKNDLSELLRCFRVGCLGRCSLSLGLVGPICTSFGSLRCCTARVEVGEVSD